MTILDLVLLISVAVLLFLVVILLAGHLRRRVEPSAPAGFLETIASRLERIDELSRKVGEITDLFLIPHMRGGIGETFLHEYLRNWLPRGAYDLQYTFKSGVRADAVVNLGGRLVVVDSKFPLESVKRAMAEQPKTLPADVKRAILRHVEDIAAKYIQPAEGTLQFALMYIPAERVYHYLFVEHESGILEEALRRSVVPVSPGTLFLYLQTVAYGLRGFSMPRSQRELADLAQQLRKELADLSGTMQLASNHLRNFQRAFDDSSSRVDRLADTVRKFTPDQGSGRAEEDAR